jgi:hypothetical protein
VTAVCVRQLMQWLYSMPTVCERTCTSSHPIATYSCICGSEASLCASVLVCHLQRGSSHVTGCVPLLCCDCLAAVCRTWAP